MKEVYDSWVSLAQEPQKDLSERREELTKKKKKSYAQDKNSHRENSVPSSLSPFLHWYCKYLTIVS